MIITKRALPRRAVLRGMGTTLALPLLDAMVPALSAAAQTAAKPIRRLGFIYVPNGVAKNDAVDYWKPSGSGTRFELSPILRPLAPLRDHVVVVSGLSQRQADPDVNGDVGDHSRASATWLNGVRPKRTEGADVEAGTTVDQFVAKAVGQDTQLPSLELGIDPTYVVGNCENGYSCVYVNTLSWRTPTTPLPIETNPRVVFERLFGQGGSPAQRRAQAQEARSILDSVAERIAGLRGTLGPTDRTRFEEYLDSVREIERRIQTAETLTADAQLPELQRPVGIPQTFGDHVRLMCDLLVLAFQTDVTRVFTFLWGREIVGRPYPEIGVPETHHGVSHHQNDPEKLAQLAKINTYHVELLVQFLQKLQSTPDGDGSLLDHVQLLYGAGLSNPQVHSHLDLPLVLVGRAGRHVAGHHLVCPTDTPMMNLLLAMMENVGVHAEMYGDSTGRLELEPLAGV